MTQKPRKNPRYRPLSAAEVARVAATQPSYGGMGNAATPWRPQEPVLPLLPLSIRSPLTHPQIAMLHAALDGTLCLRAGNVSIAGGYASIVTLRALRERGLVQGQAITPDGLLALSVQQAGSEDSAKRLRLE